MKLEYELVENALDSLREAIDYYTEGDESSNANQYKFSILLSAHCVELLMKEILRRNHPALLYEDIDIPNNKKTVGYEKSIKRIKNLCKIDLQQYETYIKEIGDVRNQIQHFNYEINGAQHKILMARTFSAIEFLFREILKLRFEDYEEIIDPRDIDFLHEDVTAYNIRKDDVAKEFKKKNDRLRIEYLDKKYIDVYCPSCGTKNLSIDSQKRIKCRLCGQEFENYSDIHVEDYNCFMQEKILQTITRIRSQMYTKVYECPECGNDSIIKLVDNKWMCLICGENTEDSFYCDECGEEVPCMERICKTAISDIDVNDYKYLCPDCAKRYIEEEEFIGYEIN